MEKIELSATLPSRPRPGTIPSNSSPKGKRGSARSPTASHVVQVGFDENNEPLGLFESSRRPSDASDYSSATSVGSIDQWDWGWVNAHSRRDARESLSSSMFSSLPEEDDVKVQERQLDKAIAHYEKKLSVLKSRARANKARGRKEKVASNKVKLSRRQSIRRAMAPERLRWLCSGIVLGIFKILFCIVFASLIHESDPVFRPSLPIGMSIQLVSTFITTLYTSWRSTIGCSISGSDIIPALTIKLMAETIAKNTQNAAAALPTLLFCCLATTVIMGIAWLLVSYFKLTRVVDYMPVSVVSGFLGCIGYKIVKEAIKVAVGDAWYQPGSWTFWKLLLPVFPLGLSLYGLGRFHIGRPAIIVSAFMILPPVIFYISSSGYELSELRSFGWLFTESRRSDFWLTWMN